MNNDLITCKKNRAFDICRRFEKLFFGKMCKSGSSEWKGKNKTDAFSKGEVSFFDSKCNFIRSAAKLKVLQLISNEFTMTNSINCMFVQACKLIFRF